MGSKNEDTLIQANARLVRLLDDGIETTRSYGRKIVAKDAEIARLSAGWDFAGDRILELDRVIEAKDARLAELTEEVAELRESIGVKDDFIGEATRSEPRFKRGDRVRATPGSYWRDFSGTRPLVNMAGEVGVVTGKTHSTGDIYVQFEGTLVLHVAPESVELFEEAE